MATCPFFLPDNQVGIDYTGDCNLRVGEKEPFDYGKWPPAAGHELLYANAFPTDELFVLNFQGYV